MWLLEDSLAPGPPGCRRHSLTTLWPWSPHGKAWRGLGSEGGNREAHPDPCSPSAAPLPCVPLPLGEELRARATSRGLFKFLAHVT